MANIYTIVNATETDPTSLGYSAGPTQYWYVPPSATGAWDGHTRQLAWTLAPDDPQSWAFTPLSPGDQGWNNDTKKHYIETLAGLKRILTVDDLPSLMLGKSRSADDPMDLDGSGPLKRTS